LAHNEPETVRRTGKVVDVQSYLVHQLTGRWATSWASADPLGLIDMTTHDWDDGLLDAANLNRGQMSELQPPGSILGTVTYEVADELALPRRLPVVAGVGDGQSAQLGTGITAPGRASLNLGTGIVSGTYSEHYSHGVEYRTLCAAVPSGYTLETFIGGGTLNLGWFVWTSSPASTAGLSASTSSRNRCSRSPRRNSRPAPIGCSPCRTGPVHSPRTGTTTPAARWSG
jgi:xylulokinase